MTPSAFVRERLIRFSDCDPAGIVFYPQYFVMFNGLVEDWVEEGLGVGYRRLIVERRIGLPTVKLEAEFRAVSRMGDRVSLGLDVARLGGRSLSLDLRCVGTGPDGKELRMRIRQVLVTTSLETHRSIDVPADLRSAIQRGDVGDPAPFAATGAQRDGGTGRACAEPLSDCDAPVPGAAP